MSSSCPSCCESGPGSTWGLTIGSSSLYFTPYLSFLMGGCEDSICFGEPSLRHASFSCPHLFGPVISVILLHGFAFFFYFSFPIWTLLCIYGVRPHAHDDKARLKSLLDRQGASRSFVLLCSVFFFVSLFHYFFTFLIFCFSLLFPLSIPYVLFSVRLGHPGG